MSMATAHKKRRFEAVSALAVLTSFFLGSCGQREQTTGRRGAQKNQKKGPSRSSAGKAERGSTTSKNRKEPARISISHTLPGGVIPDLTEQDFIENTESSRDPFRNYLKPQAAETPVESFEDTRVVLLEQYELSELKLHGIAGRRPRFAMFCPPNNRTTSVMKGVRISKSKALIVDITEDHVILQIPQLVSGRPATFVERIIWVDPNRKVVEIGSKPLKPDEQGIRYSGWRRRRTVRKRRTIKESIP